MFRPLVADVDLERKRIYVVTVLKHMVEACVRECAIFGPTKNCNASKRKPVHYRVVAGERNSIGPKFGRIEREVSEK